MGGDSAASARAEQGRRTRTIRGAAIRVSHRLFNDGVRIFPDLSDKAGLLRVGGEISSL